MKATLLALLLSSTLPAIAHASPMHSVVPAPSPIMLRGEVALTFDACGGDFDRRLAEELVSERVPVTLFVTSKWIARHTEDIAYIQAHRDIFDVQNHGAEHKAPTLGGPRGPYGVPAVGTIGELDAEVAGGEAALESAFPNTRAHWFRGATALYSPAALTHLHDSGWRVAGFSVPLDDGATLSAANVEKRALSAKPGDVLIGHINHPHAGTRDGVLAAIPILISRGIHFGWLPQ